MGIKGVYGELGAGQRVSLAKLSIDKFRECQRPLRVAVDISIWMFQTQVAQGGSNPAVRTLFYRVLRLLGHGILPVFVFDGRHKPLIKRNKRSRGGGDALAASSAKRLIRLFGCPVHDAPGEAEAECALLQRLGLVDAVLSEDVDTIMFGCSTVYRNWSAEGAGGSKSPTHVTVYSLQDELVRRSGLDREGMVLVALMSGGDYLPDGIPGCGVKLACQAARAGFGQKLCNLRPADAAGLRQWRHELIHELRTNESGFFRTKHAAPQIPDDFPNMEVLDYYTHPIVSQPDALEQRVRSSWGSDYGQPPDVQALREFTRETFDWTGRIGALKLIRVLAPSLLVWKLLESYGSGRTSSFPSVDGLVRKISLQRCHASTDGTPELRVSYVPADLVTYDLAKEDLDAVAFGRNGIALGQNDDSADSATLPGPKLSAAALALENFDPTRADVTWVPRLFLEHVAPEAVAQWEAARNAGARPRTKPRDKAHCPSRLEKIPDPVAKRVSEPSPSAKEPRKQRRATTKLPKTRDRPLHPPSRPSKQPSFCVDSLGANSLGRPQQEPGHPSLRTWLRTTPDRGCRPDAIVIPSSPPPPPPRPPRHSPPRQAHPAALDRWPSAVELATMTWSQDVPPHGPDRGTVPTRAPSAPTSNQLSSWPDKTPPSPRFIAPNARPKRGLGRPPSTIIITSSPRPPLSPLLAYSAAHRAQRPCDRTESGQIRSPPRPSQRRDRPPRMPPSTPPSLRQANIIEFLSSPDRRPVDDDDDDCFVGVVVASARQRRRPEVGAAVRVPHWSRSGFFNEMDMPDRFLRPDSHAVKMASGRSQLSVIDLTGDND